MAKKLELSFPILSDIDNRIAKQFGLVFSVAMELREVYLSFGIDLERYNGNPGWELPMPATYIIDSNGQTAYRKVNVDHTKRMEPEDLLQQLAIL